MQFDGGAHCVSPAFFGVPPKNRTHHEHTDWQVADAPGTSRRDADWCDRDGRAPQFDCIVPDQSLLQNPAAVWNSRGDAQVWLLSFFCQQIFLP
jgi:hypothetical protein